MNGDILSFLNYSNAQRDVNKNSLTVVADYQKYLSDSNVTQQTLNELSKDEIRNQYISAIKYVLLNFTSEEEKNYYKNLDLNNDNNLSDVIPLVASKLKEVAIFIAKERDRAKFSTIKYNLKGSEYGTTIYIKNYLYNLYNDPDFTSNFLNFPSLSSLNYLGVGLDYYYDRNNNYYDKDYQEGLADPELYGGGTYEKLDLLYFSKDLYFPELSGLIIENYTSIKQNYLKTSSGKILLTSKKLKIRAKILSTNIYDLDIKYFLYGEKSNDNLIFNIIREGIRGASNDLGSNKFLGTNLVYVSGANTSSPSSGALVEAANRYANILNYRNYTLQAVPNTIDLRTIKDIGGFFVANKQGLTTALSKHYSYFINQSLTGLNVTVDPAYAINPRGNSNISYPNVFNFKENPAWIINDISGQYTWGKIKAIKPYQKFNGYQSYEEVNFEYKSGINKTIDSFDFFTGVEKTVWANKDVYPPVIPYAVPLTSREYSYNVSINDIYRWQGDIYGNNFALYKKLNNYDKPDTFNTTFTSTSALNLTNFTPYSSIITATDEVVYFYRDNTYNTQAQALTTTKLYKSIQEKYDIDGEILVRTFNNTEVSTLTAAFSAVFSKYSSAIKQEINNKVNTFDIINDVIIIKTNNYHIMEKFVFNIDTDSFEPYFTFKTQLQ